MDLRQAVILTLQVSIIATVFGFGLKATADDVLYLFRRPGLLARSLTAMLVVMPIVAIVLVRTFEFVRTAEIALVALAISPVPPLLPNRERKAGGQLPYGLGLMIALGLLSIVYIPLAVELIERISGVSLGMSSGAIASMIVMMVVGPMAIAMAVRAATPALAARLAGPIDKLAVILIVLGALPLLFVVLPAVWALVGDGTVVALAIFVTIGLVTGHVFGGPDPDHAVVLALSTACRHPAIALAVAAANFPEQRFGAMIVLYLIVNIILSFLYVGWLKKRLAAVSPAT